MRCWLCSLSQMQHILGPRLSAHLTSHDQPGFIFPTHVSSNHGEYSLGDVGAKQRCYISASANRRSAVTRGPAKVVISTGVWVLLSKRHISSNRSGGFLHHKPSETRTIYAQFIREFTCRKLVFNIQQCSALPKQMSSHVDRGLAMQRRLSASAYLPAYYVHQLLRSAGPPL